MSISQSTWRPSRATVTVAAVVTLISTFVPRLSLSEEAAAAAGVRPTIAIEGVSVVDVLSGTLLDARTVLIVDGRIAATAAAAAVDVPPAAVRIDGRGRYLMPGLVDMHVHLFNNATHRAPNEWAFPLFVANGVTGVREMAAQTTDLATVASWRAAVSAGRLVAPRVLAAGVVVRGGSVASTQQQVREAHAAGANFVKVFSEVKAMEWREALEEARSMQMPVCGHTPTEVPLLEGATAGQRSNEHLMQAFEACSSKESALLRAREDVADGNELVRVRDAQERDAVQSFDQPTCDAVATALAKTDQVQIPTLVLNHFQSEDVGLDFKGDPRWQYLRADEKLRWERYLKEPKRGGPTDRRQVMEASKKIVKTMHAAGVRVLAGSDAPMPLVYPGWSLHKELELLVEAGLTPADALRSATVLPAEFLGVDESSGSIAQGKRADLLLLDANPLEEITNTQRIRAVVLDGRLFRRADLDALLRGTRSNR